MTLVQLSSAPTAVRAAANCFCQLLVSHSDNNVKLIVLDRLQVRRWDGGGWAGLDGVHWLHQCPRLQLTSGQAWETSRCTCDTQLDAALHARTSNTTTCHPPCPGPQELKDRHRDVMRDLLMDMLRALAAPNLDIRKKALDIALDLVDARNIDEVGGERAGDAGRAERGLRGEGTRRRGESGGLGCRSSRRLPTLRSRPSRLRRWWGC